MPSFQLAEAAARRASNIVGLMSCSEYTPVEAKNAFYPLTMPLTVGPGAISVAIALGSERPKEAADLVDLAVLAGAAIAGLAAVAVTICIRYRFAEPTIAALGKQGTNVVVRLSAFLLLCIGIQISPDWGASTRYTMPCEGDRGGRGTGRGANSVCPRTALRQRRGAAEAKLAPSRQAAADCFAQSAELAREQGALFWELACRA